MTTVPKTITIKTHCRRQYSRNDLGVLGYVDYRHYTIDGWPCWCVWGECPILWDGELVGTGEFPDVADFLRPLFRHHAEALIDGCNYRSAMMHEVAVADMPDVLREAVVEAALHD